MARRRAADRPAYAAGVRAGRIAAEQSLADGDPRCMTLGELSGVTLHPAGLPTASHGCEIDDESLGFCSGYNECIAAALASGAAAPFVLTAKLRSGEQLARLFEQATPLVVHGASEPCTIADSGVQVIASMPAGLPTRWFCDEALPTGAWLTEWFSLELRRGSSACGHLRCAGVRAEVVLVDDGTTAVVRTRQPETVTYVVLELVRAGGFELQTVISPR